MKINSNNNLRFFRSFFKYNICMIPCNFLNGKTFWKYIYSPSLVLTEHIWSTCRTISLLAEISAKYKLWSYKISCPSSVCLFLLKNFSLYQTYKVFITFISIIVGITIAPLNIDWLAYFWRLITLIDSFEFNINTCWNISNSLQPLVK